jgi:hypothetical protein
MSRLQALQAHELGLNSIWDAPWASSTGAAAAGSNGTHGSNGNGSSNGKSSLSAAQPTGGNGNSSGGATSLGSNGKAATSMAAGAADAVAASSGGSSSSSNNCQPSGGRQGAGEQAVPAPAQEGQEFTTWKFRSSGVAKRTIDYIWYTGAQLVPVSRWRMLSEAEIGPSGLPNTMYPSDHMAVTCQFGWVDMQ